LPGRPRPFSVHEVAHNHVEWWAARDITTLVMLPLSASWPRKWLGGHDDLRCMPFILRGTPQETAMILRERHATGPRFRSIVAGERGAAEYVTLAGFPLAISYHSAQPLDGSGPCPAMSLKAPATATGRSSAPGSCASVGGQPTRTRRSSGLLWKRGTPAGNEPCASPPHSVVP
jgi:hypothetical protein